MMISSTSFESNTAGVPLISSTSPSGFGGALHLGKSTAVFRNCSLLSNLAGSGGAISGQQSSILNFTGSSNVIKTNTATNGGAAQVCCW